MGRDTVNLNVQEYAFSIFCLNIERWRSGNSTAKWVPHFNAMASNTSSPYIKITLNMMYFVSCSGIVMMDFVIDSEEITKLTWKKIMKWVINKTAWLKYINLFKF